MTTSAEEKAELQYDISLEHKASVILCAWRNLLAETAECMMMLRDRGWNYMIKRGDALISRSRSSAVSHWYLTQKDEDVFLMIDDDMVFEPSGAERVVALAREKRSIAIAAYPVKDGTHFAFRRLPEQNVINFGYDQSPIEVKYPATGFMAVHRDVIDAMVAAKDSEGKPVFPLCDVGGLLPMWAFFDTFTMTYEDGKSEYLSEDYAFGEQALRLGFKTWLDPSVILYHMGFYPYTLENMSTAVVSEEVIETPSGFKVALDPKDNFICESLRRTGYWDKTTYEHINDNLREGDLFLDLGAHIGYYSLLAASRGNQVIAVEPMSDALKYFHKSVDLNHFTNIEIVEGVVAPENGKAYMFPLSGNTGATFRIDVGGIEVEAYTIDEILGENNWPDVIKIDIEGDEYRVLNTPSGKSLLKHARVIIFELSDQQLQRNSGVPQEALLALLQDAGFELNEIASHPTYSDWIGVKNAEGN